MSNDSEIQFIYFLVICLQEILTISFEMSSCLEKNKGEIKVSIPLNLRLLYDSHKCTLQGQYFHCVTLINVLCKADSLTVFFAMDFKMVTICTC